MSRAYQSPTLSGGRHCQHAVKGLYEKLSNWARSQDEHFGQYLVTFGSEAIDKFKL